MATNFPTSLDSYTTRANGGVIDASHVNDLQLAMVAVETRVGITGSADAVSLTKRIAVLEAAGSGGGTKLFWPDSGTGTSGASAAWKGAYFTPSQALSLDSLIWKMNGLPGAWQAKVVTVSAGAIASVVATSNNFTVAAAGGYAATYNTFKFASPVSLASGTKYGLIFGPTFGSGTAAIAAFLGESANINPAGLPGTFDTVMLSLGTVTPIVTSVVSSSADQRPGVGFFFV